MPIVSTDNDVILADKSCDRYKIIVSLAGYIETVALQETGEIFLRNTVPELMQHVGQPLSSSFQKTPTQAWEQLRHASRHQ